MSSLLSLAGNAAPTGFYDFPIEQSLRFNDNDSAYLSRSITSAGNRKTFTISCWVKRANLGLQGVYSARQVKDDTTALLFENDDKLVFTDRPSNVRNIELRTNRLFRDVGAWYHIVIKIDTTQATASDRVKMYVNGEEQTSFTTSNYPSQNYDVAFWNNAHNHVIGYIQGNSPNYFDGYLAEVNFIDGQALDPTSFGELKSGIWIPRDTSGLSYGNNGFRLNFADTVTASGFNALTWTGDAANPKSVNGCGFSPDFVWAKARSSAFWHRLYDSVRGANKALFSNATSAETTDAAGEVTSFDSDGFTFSGSTNNSNLNNNGTTYVAWCWDAGSGSPVSNTDGSITSTVKANTDYGFSIVSYTGTGANATVGHGLGGTAPDMIIVKNRNLADSWLVKHSSFADDNKALFLNETGQAGSSSTYWNNTAPTATVFSVGTDGKANGSGQNIIAYCFAEKTGFSKFGSYTGTGSSGLSVTGLGFKPAFLMVKSSTAAESWQILDNTREVAPDEKQDLLFANLSNAEVAMSGNVEFTDDGFNVNTTIGNFNTSGQTYLFMAFKDTRDAAFWRDVSGQGNDWQHNNLTFSDVVLDGTNNFATMNPLAKGTGTVTFSEGNLKSSFTFNLTTTEHGSTHTLPQSGKWYWEQRFTGALTSGSQALLCGIMDVDTLTVGNSGNKLTSSGDYVTFYTDNNTIYINNSLTAYTSEITDQTSAIVGFAVDMDNGHLWVHVNGTYINGTPNFSTGGNKVASPNTDSTYLPFFNGNGGGSGTWIANFGQDSTFAGNKAAGGNADENGYGDFQYAPPSSFLSLCSANMPKGAIDTLNDETPEDYFNTVLYSGNSTNNTPITVGFEPSMTWIKTRNVVRDHRLMDAVRGATAGIYPNLTNAEGASPLLSFDSDGFTLNNTNNYNNTGETYASWNWKAGGAGVSNTDGSITSTVSVGATSQQNWFSIVSYTGDGTIASGSNVGHGLGRTPDAIIVKDRDAAVNWNAWFNSFTGSQVIYPNLTNARNSDANVWSATVPTSSVFYVGNGEVNASSNNYIAYCFANAEGLCKVGKFSGNGSTTDGVFVYTGFRPAYLLYKQTTAAANWEVIDNTRNPYNVSNARLFPSNSSAENTAETVVDLLSNGFKARDAYGGWNSSGQSYIYLAIAEQPFKYANAR